MQTFINIQQSIDGIIEIEYIYQDFLTKTVSIKFYMVKPQCVLVKVFKTIVFKKIIMHLWNFFQPF